MGATIFAESVRRLYQDGMVDRDKIMDLYKSGKLTIEEVNFILDSNSDSDTL